jgi:Tetrapyrrole (Corrin/Porphyrin) Methylases
MLTAIQIAAITSQSLSFPLRLSSVLKLYRVRPLSLRTVAKLLETQTSYIVLEVRDPSILSSDIRTQWASAVPSRQNLANLFTILNAKGCAVRYISQDWRRVGISGSAASLGRLNLFNLRSQPAPEADTVLSRDTSDGEAKIIEALIAAGGVLVTLATSTTGQQVLSYGALVLEDVTANTPLFLALTAFEQIAVVGTVLVGGPALILLGIGVYELTAAAGTNGGGPITPLLSSGTADFPLDPSTDSSSILYCSDSAVNDQAVAKAIYKFVDEGLQLTLDNVPATPPSATDPGDPAAGDPGSPNDNDDDNNNNNNDDDNNNNNNDDDNNNNNNDDDNNDDEDDGGEEIRTVARRSGSDSHSVDPRSSPSPRGRLVVVGTGITAVAQMTLETVAHIRAADCVFYHATNGVTASQIRALNKNAVDLYQYYGEGKERRATYVEMAELMLRQVRRGETVVGAFHGHPGYFVSPARRALAIAELEGHETLLLAAVSSTDCMFSDLRVDPGVFGSQVMMANLVLRDDIIVSTSGHVVLLQVNAVGDSGFSFRGYRNATLGPFFEKLIQIYGEDQESIYYVAAIFPTFKSDIVARKLGEYRRPEIANRLSSGILYLPPKGLALASLQAAQAFGGKGRRPYGAFESGVISKLDTHVVSKEFIKREASGALYRAMLELGTNAAAQHAFKSSPAEFVKRFDDLSEGERIALISGNARAVRAASSQ